MAGIGGGAYRHHGNDSANWSPGPVSRQGTPVLQYSDFDPYRDFPNADNASQYSRPRDSFIAPSFPGTRPGSMVETGMRDSFVGGGPVVVGAAVAAAGGGVFQGQGYGGHQGRDSMDSVTLRTPTTQHAPFPLSPSFVPGAEGAPGGAGDSGRPVSHFGVQGVGVALSDPPVPVTSSPSPTPDPRSPPPSGPPPMTQQIHRMTSEQSMHSSVSMGNIPTARLVQAPSPSPSHPEFINSRDTDMGRHSQL